jgi:hypothetical protein
MKAVVSIYHSLCSSVYSSYIGVNQSVFDKWKEEMESSLNAMRKD